MNDAIVKGRERPILMSGPMVVQTLADLKTQTRRLVQPTPGRQSTWLTPELVAASPSATLAWSEGRLGAELEHPRGGPLGWIACPYGEPGDRLWVRETWRPTIAHSCGAGHCDCADVIVTYAADGAEVVVSEYENRPGFDEWTMPVAAARGDVPGIHMPRWASRILLEITEVRVERLQAIGEEDARAEGLRPHACGWSDGVNGYDTLTARQAFGELWDEINGERAPWASNPWVWAVSFRRVQP